MNDHIQGLFFIKMFDVFLYTPAQQRGIVVLIILLVLALCMRFWPWQNHTEIDFHLTAIDTARDVQFVVQKVKQNQGRRWDLETFDINYAKARDLRRMGFPNKFIQEWFAEKQDVGFVKSVEQFQKMKLLSAAEYDLVVPFLDFTRYAARSKQTAQPRHIAPVTIDVNLADSISLKKLPGIGKTLSKRIVKYRSALGGFVNIEQLKEVYGISDSLFEMLLPQMHFTPQHKLLQVNTANVAELKSHPYIKYRQANSIVSYRTMHGPFTDLGDFQRIHNLDSNWIKKVEPYVSFD